MRTKKSFLPCFLLVLLWSICIDAFSPHLPQSHNKKVFSNKTISSLHSTASSTSASSTDERTVLLKNILQNAKENGPIGIESSQSSQDAIQQLAQNLKAYSIADPTSYPLRGTHSLLYSLAHSTLKDGTKKAAASSGKVGPLNGEVTQEFPNDTDFYNIVRLFGGFIKVSLRAERKALDSEKIKVMFREMSFTIGGVEVMKKDIGGGGIWKVLFVGEFEENDGKKMLIRVMETPNLFVLAQEM